MATIIQRMVLISGIEDDIELCMRANGLNTETVAAYAAAMKAGAVFPAIEITQVNSLLLLTNGFHRRAAALKIGAKEILANISEGSEIDARLAAIRADSHDGLRRSNTDKRRAVMLALKTPEIADAMNDRDIANMAGVDQKFVWKLRNQNSVKDNPKLKSSNRGVPASPKRKVGKDGKRYPTKKNKKKPTPVLKVVCLPQAKATTPFTPEQFAHARAHDPGRHVFTRPIEEEIRINNQQAAREFCGKIREIGTIADSLLNNGGAKFERHGHKNNKQPFTQAEFFDTLATMENGGILWYGKLIQHADAIIAVAKLIEPLIVQWINREEQAS